MGRSTSSASEGRKSSSCKWRFLLPITGYENYPISCRGAERQEIFTRARTFVWYRHGIAGEGRITGGYSTDLIITKRHHHDGLLKLKGALGGLAAKMAPGLC